MLHNGTCSLLDVINTGALKRGGRLRGVPHVFRSCVALHVSGLEPAVDLALLTCVPQKCRPWPRHASASVVPVSARAAVPVSDWASAPTRA